MTVIKMYSLIIIGFFFKEEEGIRDVKEYSGIGDV